jgi:Spy/CpxP family protein refolding chaperone
MIRRWLMQLSLLVAVLLVAGVGIRAAVQRADPALRTRLQVLTDAFALDKDQKNEVKILMDGAYKTAAPIRADLTKTRLALAQAAIENKSEADVAAATKAYAAAATAMTALEMKTLAQMLAMLKPEQKDAGLQEVFYMMRGALQGDKKWDETPDQITY